MISLNKMAWVPKSLRWLFLLISVYLVLLSACLNDDTNSVQPELLTGKWQVRNEYKLLYPESREPVLLLGWGEVFIIYNGETGTFTGLGWVNRGTHKSSLETAKVDTLNTTFVCFEIDEAHRDAITGSWKLRTRTIHRTSGGAKSECNFGRVECQVEFPPEVSLDSWTGKGTCQVGNLTVQLTLKLTKVIGE